MYHRYIPAAGGGYLCRTVREPPRRESGPPGPEPCSASKRGPAKSAPPPAPVRRRDETGFPHGLLGRLFPEDLEADDILIVLILLLLMLDGGDGDALTALVAAAAFLILR